MGLCGGMLKLGLQNGPRMGHLNGFLAQGRVYLSINGATWENVEAWPAKKASLPTLRHQGCFARRDVCASATEIPY